MHNNSVNPELVKEVIANLDSSKASGPDCIPLIVKYKSELSYSTSLTLQYVFEGILFPRLLVPVSENVGQKSMTKNYHPSSLCSVVSKVFEKLVNNRLLDHLEKYGLFSDI